jgi:copper(I)-binding protein
MSRTKRTALMPLLVAGASLALVAAPAWATDPSPEPMAESEAMDITVTEPWARESMMLELAGAAYMVIHNGTDTDDALVGASSPAAAVVEIHETSMDEDGMVSMAHVMEIPLPAHADTVLRPGGYHVMLIDLVDPLVEGEEIEITLEFRDAEDQIIVAPVRASGPMAGMDMGDEEGMDMGHDMDGMQHSKGDMDAGMHDDTAENEDGE